jgi:hypothetical protein
MNPISQLFNIAARIQREGRVDYTESHRIAARENPELATLAAAYGKTRQQVQMCNERTSGLATGGRLDPERRNKFQSAVADRMKENGGDYTAAFNYVQKYHPEFCNAGEGAQTNDSPSWPKSGVSSDRVASKDGAVPVAGPQFKALFRLPQDCTPEEFAAAWKGNGNTAQPLHFGKIFAALADHLKGSEGDDAGMRKARIRFPMLWDAVKALSETTV